MGFQDSLPDEREQLPRAIYPEGLCGPDRESDQAAPLMLPQKNMCDGRDQGQEPQRTPGYIFGELGWLAGLSLTGHTTVA